MDLTFPNTLQEASSYVVEDEQLGTVTFEGIQSGYIRTFCLSRSLHTVADLLPWSDILPGVSMPTFFTEVNTGQLDRSVENSLQIEQYNTSKQCSRVLQQLLQNAPAIKIMAIPPIPYELDTKRYMDETTIDSLKPNTPYVPPRSQSDDVPWTL